MDIGKISQIMSPNPSLTILRYFLCGLLPLCAAAGLAQDSAALTQRLNSAAASTALDTAGMNPWYLKIAVQLYDDKGKPSEQGTIEEWWAGPGREKRTYSFPSGSTTEIRDSGHLYRQRSSFFPSPLIQVLLDQVVHPMPQSADVAASQPEFRKLNLGKIPVECIMLAQPIKGIKSSPIGLFPTYCFDPGRDFPRVIFDFGTQVVIHNQIGRFQQKFIPIDVVVKESDSFAASGHITSLMSKEITDADLKTDMLSNVEESAKRVDAGTMSGILIKRPDPGYPESAKANHVSGKVVLRALIGKDGRIHKLSVISSPDADLAVASIAAVRQWTYKPYMLNGELTDVDTTITVNFTFN